MPCMTKSVAGQARMKVTNAHPQKHQYITRLAPIRSDSTPPKARNRLAVIEKTAPNMPAVFTSKW